MLLGREVTGIRLVGTMTTGPPYSTPHHQGSRLAHTKGPCWDRLGAGGSWWPSQWVRLGHKKALVGC